MIITYHGLSCFKIQSGETTLVFDLPSKKSNIKPPRFQADIAFQSHDHPGHCGAEEIPNEKGTFLINGPGEYEVKGIYVEGLLTYHDSIRGKKYGLNTAYVIRLENMKLGFMGDYGEKELRPEIKEAIGKVDILFAPIGGETVLEPEASQNLINQLEPAIVIPMHYVAGGKKDMLKAFLAEFGQKEVKPLEKLSVRKKDIGENGTQIVILEAQ